MPLGPVFNAELLTTARRARYYVIRAVYGIIILFQIYVSYEMLTTRYGTNPARLRISEMADFGRQIFLTFAILQAVAVVFLTPALVGGAIADERQRKTLHYLLTSELSSAEIILGKLAARLLHVGVLVALGLPVVSLIGLFGGIDFEMLWLSYAGTMTTIYFIATASILVSVVSRRPREAISTLYALEIIWLVVPTIVMNLIPHWDPPWPTVAEWINPVLEFVAITSPIDLLSPKRLGTLLTSGGTRETFLWGMGLQLAYGTAFIVLASLRLRPSSRNEGGDRGLAGWLTRITRKRRWFPRPACGDDAMSWKEKYVARTGGATKLGLVLVGVALVGIIGYSTWGYLRPSFDEMWTEGYSKYGLARGEFNTFLRIVSVSVYVLWMLGVASSAATGISAECEEDQWITLTSTPLSGSEILRAKMIGPIWGLRLVAYLLFLLWAVGLVVGAIHPIGVIACLVEFVVYSWFLTALGTFFSLRAKNSTRSLASTIAVLLFLNGGYLFCCIPFQPESNSIVAASTPAVLALSLMSVEDLAQIWRYDQSWELVPACALAVFCYGVAAGVLTVQMHSGFDAIVDRPDLSHQFRTPNQQREFLDGRPKVTKRPDELA